MKSLENEVRELRDAVTQLRYEIARKEARQAMPLAPRHGRWLGITRKDYTQGGADEFIEVDVWIWEPSLSAWKKKPVAPFGFIKARDWYLNDGELLEKNIKVKVEYYETTWVVTGMYCSPTDLPEFGGTPGGLQTGEYEPSMPYSPAFVSSGGSYGDSYSSPGFEE